MSEQPLSAQDLCADLRALGVGVGQTVFVHTSVRRIGYVIGGPQAATITARHDLDCPSGERSPLAALYELDATVLQDGVREWRTWEELAVDDEDFVAVAEAYAAAGLARQVRARPPCP